MGDLKPGGYRAGLLPGFASPQPEPLDPQVLVCTVSG